MTESATEPGGTGDGSPVATRRRYRRLLVGTVVVGVLAALGLPLAVITLGLAALARSVASKPDEPALVDDRLAENIDMSSEEYRELTEERSRD